MKIMQQANIRSGNSGLSRKHGGALSRMWHASNALLGMLAVPLAAMLVIGAGGFYANRMASHALETQKIADAREMSRAMSGAVEHFWIAPWTRAVKGMASSPAMQCVARQSHAACERHLHQEWDSVLRAGTNFFFVYYGLADGRMGYYPNSGPLPDGYDMRKRPWYLAGMRAQTDLAWLAPYAEAVTGETVVTAVVPLRRADGVALGVFAADIDLHGLQSLLESLYLPPDSSLTLYDDKGGRLAGVAAGAARPPPTGEPEGPNFQPGVARMLHQEGKEFLQLDSAPLSNGWHFRLLLAGPSGSAANGIILATALACFAVLLLTVTTVGFRLHRTRQRTRELVAYFEEAARGQTPLRNIFTRRDEYALLNRHFNRALLRARKYAAERALREKNAFELTFVRAQINPHFLHNAIATIISLLRTDPAVARRLLLHLSSYLRSSFDFLREDHLAPLHAEIALVQSWLAIQQARFEHGVEVHFDIQADTTHLVPVAMLKPIVENALHHGILAQRENGCIAIRIHEIADAADGGGRLEFCVCDDGAGFHATRPFPPGRNGIGLASVEHTLFRLYRSRLKIDSEPGQGTRVEWNIPLAPVTHDHA